MSLKIKGAIFASGEDAAVEFFCNINPTTFLRLTELEPGLWGIYAEGWPGDQEVLDEIARSASVTFGMSLSYFYHSTVDFISELYENGRLTRTEDTTDTETPQFTGCVFEVFGRDSSLHDVVETKFNWHNQDWLLEMDSRD